MSAAPSAAATRVVVVGNGMAGARLVEELRRRDPALDVTVLGAEEVPAYNRVLLSDVLAGTRRPADVALADAGVARLGVRVVAVDRDARTVTGDDGSTHPYDALVLATGSTPVVPPVHGVAGPDGRLLPGVFVFRTLQDCAAIAHAAGRARRAVVVGGGLLGLEAARGLLQHGLQVDVVHGAPHLMDAQLDRLGGALLRRSVEALGVGVHLGAPASSVTGSRSVTGVGLADGRHVAGDLVVLACGVRPETSLARAAGLAVERGVLVDDQLTTSDPDVFALGECAQHRGTVHGLVAPAWEQAAVLAQVLTGAGRGAAAAYTGSRTVARLKAMDLEVAAMGDVAPSVEDALADPGLEVLTHVDTGRCAYAKLVVRDDVLVGAVLLGDLTTAGPVTQAFDRGTPLPPDRRHLLPAARGAVAGPPGDDDVVCTCNGVTAGALRTCGARTVPDAAARTRATTGCGTCRGPVAEILAALPSAASERTPA